MAGSPDRVETTAWFDADLARRIDHTLLRPEAVEADIDRLCDEAARFAFAAVCVQPVFCARAAARLEGTGVRVAVVVGFPHGATTPAAKCFEAARAAAEGAREIDMVANLGWLKAGLHRAAHDEIAAVVEAVRPVEVKVIIETAVLADEQKVAATAVVRAAGAHFVKTSTGFGPGGATVADVRLLSRAAGTALRVKASGGIRTRGQALRLVAAGAARLGCSASVAIVRARP